MLFSISSAQNITNQIYLNIFLEKYIENVSCSENFFLIKNIYVILK